MSVTSPARELVANDNANATSVCVVSNTRWFDSVLGSLTGAILSSIDVEKEQKEMRGCRRGAVVLDPSCGRDWFK